MEQCVVVTSPETGETYRVRVDGELTAEEERDLALYMDAIAKAARNRLGASGGT